MSALLNTSDKSFSAAFAKLIAEREGEVSDVAGVVADIIKQVREKKDVALCEYTKKFDRNVITPKTMRVSAERVANALALVSPELMKSLKVAAARIRSYSEKQLPADLGYTDDTGTFLGHRWSAIDAVGLYVPGGLAAYPSSVLMNAIPALVAGVERLVMVVPAPDGVLNPAVLAAAHIAGIEEIYTVGGAQAVAALAYGTETISPVDKIVGPGNAYVAEAKRQVFGKVGIDMIAGPSEILVVADGKNDAAWIAADLLSQAEHDSMAQSILITDDTTFATKVSNEIEEQLRRLQRENIARASWQQHGAIIIVKDMDEACELVNQIAPEHLELAVDKPETLLPHIRHAGAIFMGRHTPEAMGDYLSGPSHVLPTSGTARFSSGLSVFDFLKRSSLIGHTSEALSALAPYATTLAEAEGLMAHYHSVAVRKP